jgi:uncharacterized protein YggE
MQQLGLKSSQVRLGRASSYPNYAQDAQGRRTNQIESWTTTQQVTVKAPFKSANNLVGKIYSTATGFNNVRISGPSAEISDSAIRSAEARARARAVSAAVKEAKAQVKASGVARLGKLLTVSPTDQGGYYQPRGMMLERAAAANVEAPKFSSPEKQTLTQTVNATFQLKSKGMISRLLGR